MEIITKLGYQAIVEYVTNNSELTIDQFIFAMEGNDGYASFLASKNNKIVRLGRLSYNCFVCVDIGTTEDFFALTKFLDLCIQKLDDDKVVVPDLYANITMRNKVYCE